MRIVFVMLLAAAGLAAGEEGLPWGTEDDLWHAPSRKASNYAYKYQARLQQLKKGLARQGEEMRLPRDVLPVSYNIVLLPFIEENNFTTKGYIEIEVKCQTATSVISMNAADLHINNKSIEVTHISSGERLAKRNYTDEQVDREIISIHLEKSLTVGERYRVSIEFVSILNDELRGFYRSTYEENGKTKYLAVSQMEAPDARRAFPCFDEPNMKAKFSITIGRKKNMSAISNMPIRRTEKNTDMPGYVWDYFDQSVVMSSYLVAMMVSEFVGFWSTNPNIPFKTWARPSYASQTQYSNEIGPKILLDYANKYFNIPFPLPKVDMAAIPDFAAGAMENWGLITYREADLLFDPVRSSASAKQRVATIIAHELAHQWFGNLVTMDWWNVIWLNEGFASYMEYPGTHYVEPGFEMNEQFNVLDLHYVFEIDALESSRPIDYEVNTPDQINQMFDAISYEKGSCVIRMCANFLGEPTFRRGITRYLNRHSYGNTVQEDLWAALQEQADEESVALPVSVKTIMDTWTRQMGYPVVNVTRLYDPTNGANVTQNRFMLRKSANSTDHHNYRWWIPLTYTSNFSNPIESHWYPSNQGNGDIMLPLKDSSPSRWVIFNVGQEGYYRVVYDERNIHMIHHQLMTNHKAISNKNRAQLLDDYLNLARAGVAPYEIALDLTKYLENERDYAPWTAASVALDYINTMLYSLADEAIWKNYMVSLVNPLYGFVGYEYSASDSHLKIFTRSQAVSWACVKLGMADCVTKSKADYAAWMNDAKKELSPNLRRLVSCTAIANGNRTEWNFGYQKYLVSVLPNEKTELLRAITCTYDIAILNEMLEMMINSTSGIRLQDVNTLFSNIAANPVGHGVALDFLNNRWDDVYAYFGGYQGFGGGSMSRLFRYLCTRVNTKEKLDKLTKLWNDHADVLQRSASARQGMEGAQANVQWVERYYGTVMAWLKSPLTTTTPVPTTPSSSTSVYNLSQFVTAMVAVFLAKLALQAY